MTKTPKWTVIFTPHAEKAFAKLDRPVQKEIERYLSTRVLMAEHPRSLGKPLKGNLSDYWSYRSGYYRIICKIEDHELVIVVVRVAHRRQVYAQH
jgi:mRNA interferase RelE/StbE